MSPERNSNPFADAGFDQEEQQSAAPTQQTPTKNPFEEGGFETAVTALPQPVAERLALGHPFQSLADKGYWENTKDVFKEGIDTLTAGFKSEAALDPELVKKMKEMGATDASIETLQSRAKRGQIGFGIMSGAWSMLTSPVMGGVRQWGSAKLEDDYGIPHELTEFGANIPIGIMVGGLVKMGGGKLGRMVNTENGPKVEPLGPPPKIEDFQNAAATAAEHVAKTTESGKVSEALVETVKKNLMDAWEQKGIHPSELVEAAERSPFVAHDLGAAAAVPNDLPPPAPLNVAPPPRVGLTMSSVREGQAKLKEIYDSLHMSTSPIGMSNDKAMLAAADLGNTLRWNRWQWTNLDEDLKLNWTPERRSFMWEALDQESMAVQYGDSQLVFHGSPHFFDQFAIKAIGTGEGAQVYGHGLYFAEAPGTAKAYQAALSKMNPTAAHWLEHNNWDSGKALNAFETKLAREAVDIKPESAKYPGAKFIGYNDEGMPLYEKGLERLMKKPDGEFIVEEKGNNKDWAKTHAPVSVEKAKAIHDQIRQEIKKNVGGHFFTVKIDIPKEHFLDWDKPVAEQPRLISILEEMGKKGEFDQDTLKQYLAGSGEGVMRALGEKLTPAGASKLLLANDVKGVRYLDGQSRSKGEGTHNFVTFDDKEVQIIHTDGKPLTPEQIKQLHIEQEATGRPAFGLSALDPQEHAKVADLHARSAHAWITAVDEGIVKGIGIPFYTPRYIVNAMGSVLTGRGPTNLNGKPAIKVSTDRLKMRKYMDAGDTEEAAKAKFGEEAYLAHDIRALPLATAMLEDAVAGRRFINQIKENNPDHVVEGWKPSNDYFTIPEHPGFYNYEFNDGKMQAKPIYIHKSNEGAVRAIMRTPNAAWVDALLDLKSRAMGSIMGTVPFIHHGVVLGKVFEGAPGQTALAPVNLLAQGAAAVGNKFMGPNYFTPHSFGIYARGTRALANPAMVEEAILRNGLVPIGRRFFKQDIDSVMAAPEMVPGQTWTNKLLTAVPDLFSEKAGDVVAQRLQQFHDFRQNTLLWDQVQKMQFGMYDHLRGVMIRGGVDASTAGKTSAYFSNMLVGSLPQEAMSQNASNLANALLFSRSYTLSNWAILKMMVKGLPPQLMAQIARDAGGELTPQALATINSTARGIAQRKAIGIGVTSVVGFYGMMTLLQSGLNIMSGRTDLPSELSGYARRTSAAIEARQESPLKWLQMLDLLENISSTGDNEPGKKDRIRFSTASDGTAQYFRNPFGKFAEELIDMTTSPLQVMRRKGAPDASFLLDIMSNDKGFGRKIYDPSSDTIGEETKAVMEIGKHFIGKHFPTQNINPLVDMVEGHGDPGVNFMRALLPFVGLQTSQGASGGPAIGVMRNANQKHEYQMQLAMPDIYRKIQDGKEDEARDDMDRLGVATRLREVIIRGVKDPNTRFRASTMKKLDGYMSPEQKRNMQRFRDDE